MPDAAARGDRFHGTDDDFDPPADVPVAIDPVGLADAVAQFRALSDAAGNPGAPRATHWDASNPPPIPDPNPGPGVYGTTELARAAAPHYGPDPVSAYHLLNQRIDTLTAKLDDLAAKQAEDLGAILARLPLNPTVDRTPPRPGNGDVRHVADPFRCGRPYQLTEHNPTHECNREPGHQQGGTHEDRSCTCRCGCGWLYGVSGVAAAGEGAPPEGPGPGPGPLIPTENWTSADTEAEGA